MSQIIYWFLYLAKSFSIWEFKNPFQWIIDLPNYEIITRVVILLLVPFYYVVIIFIIDMRNNFKND